MSETRTRGGGSGAAECSFCSTPAFESRCRIAASIMLTCPGVPTPIAPLDDPLADLQRRELSLDEPNDSALRDLTSGDLDPSGDAPEGDLRIAR